MLVRSNYAAQANLRVDSSGRLHAIIVSGSSVARRARQRTATWLFSLNGELLEVLPEEPPPSEERTLFEEVGLLGNTRATLERVDDLPIVSEFGENRGMTSYFAHDGVPQHLFAADGAIWIETLRGMTRHFEGAAREITFGDDTRFSATLSDPEGGALVTLSRVATGSSPAEVLSTGRLNAAGEFRWQLPVHIIRGEPLHANDGVLYIVETNHVAAWQLDFLPMPHACLSPRFGCNAQRDGWVRPTPTEPATLRR